MTVFQDIIPTLTDNVFKAIVLPISIALPVLPSSVSLNVLDALLPLIEDLSFLNKNANAVMDTMN